MHFLRSAILAALFTGYLAAAPASRPNIVLFLSDDHGWRNSGAYGDTYVKTPNIDRLAREGMRFTRAFAASPLCSPSRCTIETGLMPFRNGGHKFGTPIHPGIKTMPMFFKKLGYYTAHIGKFHHAPRKAFPYDTILMDENKAAGFIDAYDNDKPLLLLVCTHPPHTPWIENKIYDPAKIKLPPNFIDTPETRTDRARYYSDVTLMDTILGDVLAALDRKNMSSNTLLLYTTDQGANWPFAKWCLYDEGLRVPFIVRWPGTVKPGATSEAMCCLSDLLPTFLDAAGAAPPENIDGRSLVPVLRGEQKEFRSAVFGTHTGNDNGGPGIANHCPARTIRTPRFRYIVNLSPETTFTTHITGCKSGPHYLPFWDSWVKAARTDARAREIVNRYQHRPSEELYGVLADPYEMHNLADDPAYATTKKALRKRLLDWCHSQGETDPF